MIAIIRKFIELIIYGNIWISLGAVALTLNTFLVMDWSVNSDFLLLVFFATTLSYCFQRIVRHKSGALINSARHQWVYSQKKFFKNTKIPCVDNYQRCANVPVSLLCKLP